MDLYDLDVRRCTVFFFVDCCSCTVIFRRCIFTPGRVIFQYLAVRHCVRDIVPYRVTRRIDVLVLNCCRRVIVNVLIEMPLKLEEKLVESPFEFENGERCAKIFSSQGGRYKHMLIRHLAFIDRGVKRGYRVHSLDRGTEELWRNARRRAMCTTDAEWPPAWYFDPDSRVRSASTSASRRSMDAGRVAKKRAGSFIK